MQPRHAPADRRLGETRKLDQACEVPAFGSREAWEACAAELRRHLLVSSGLWPLPDRTPLNPVLGGRIDHEDYSIENVYFESHPGFLVAGNLYRPLGRAGPCPAVLNPHGHWDHGCLQHDDTCSVPARGISLARQGYVAFAYDMVGFLDSRQVPHTFGGPLEELWGISLMGLLERLFVPGLRRAGGLHAALALAAPAATFIHNAAAPFPADIANLYRTAEGRETFLWRGEGASEAEIVTWLRGQARDEQQGRKQG